MHSRQITWVLPALIVLAATAYLVAFSFGGKVQLGLEAFGVTAVVGLGLLVLGDRSETIRGLGGDERDEPTTRVMATR